MTTSKKYNKKSSRHTKKQSRRLSHKSKNYLKYKRKGGGKMTSKYEKYILDFASILEKSNLKKSLRYNLKLVMMILTLINNNDFVLNHLSIYFNGLEPKEKKIFAFAFKLHSEGKNNFNDENLIVTVSEILSEKFEGPLYNTISHSGGGEGHNNLAPHKKTLEFHFSGKQIKLYNDPYTMGLLTTIFYNMTDDWRLILHTNTNESNVLDQRKELCNSILKYLENNEMMSAVEFYKIYFNYGFSTNTRLRRMQLYGQVPGMPTKSSSSDYEFVLTEPTSQSQSPNTNATYSHLKPKSQSPNTNATYSHLDRTPSKRG